MKVTHGDIIKIAIKKTAVDANALSRTMSTYQYGLTLRGEPKPEQEYIVSSKAYEDLYGDECSCFLLVDRIEPETPIGFALVYVDNEPHVVVTQTNFQPRPVTVTHVGRITPIEDVPEAKMIGSQVFVVGNLVGNQGSP